ncbi:hypothetical protein C7K55_12745 [Cyanobium usitatum str. Tous]|uniref:Uncharacterized protein n=1 Tax=Cyanobium usitatum str. Tous TaxID=2116684 RepID=A0A2P7MQH0_9CYAN|nr:hypothetical protein C7K55_12745 [Cyanobium usitatum str. Tous]
MVIAAASKKAAKDITPITSVVTYDLGKIAQKNLVVTGDLKETYVAGLKFVGTTTPDTLVFGSATEVNGAKVKTKISNTTVDLSAGGADTFKIDGQTSVKKTTVIVDANDKIINKKGQTFTSADINKNGKIKGLGGISFQVK